MSDEYFRKSPVTKERRAGNFINEAQRQIQDYKEKDKEIPLFIKRSIADKYFQAAKLYREIGDSTQTIECYSSAVTYAPNSTFIKTMDNELGIKNKGQKNKKNRIIEGRGIEKKLSEDEKWTIVKKNFERFIENQSRDWAIISIVALSVSLFFISSNLTGFAISNLSNTNVQWLGFGFFVIGLIFAFVYFRKKKFSKDL